MAARLVEVIADQGESRYRYGSGCIVRGRTVLTAAHVVAGAQRIQVRDPDKTMYSATMDRRFVGDADGPGPDLALVEIDDAAVDLPPMELARVDRDGPTDEPVERCHAIGYPWFAETPSPAAVRDTVDAIGVVPVLSKLAAGLLSVQVSISPRPLPPKQVRLEESEWSGMSGGPVVAAGQLLGVVAEHAPREGPSAITAVPLTALEQDPAHPGWGPGVKDPAAWWARLGVSGLADLQRLPAAPERPEHLRELESRLPLGPADVTALQAYLVAVVKVLDRDLWREAAGGRPFSVTSIERTLAVRSSNADADDATRIERLDATALGASCERLVVVGGAGAGKSWLARRYAIRAAEAALVLLKGADDADEVEIPLFARCAPFLRRAGRDSTGLDGARRRLPRRDR